MSEALPSLMRCRMLQDLTSEELSALALRLEEREVHAGSPVFRAGDEADELLVIAAGSVRLERGPEALGVLVPGEVLGGASLSAIGRRACDAIADEDVRLLALSRVAYLRLRADLPCVALALHEGLMRELASNVRALVGSGPA